MQLLYRFYFILAQSSYYQTRSVFLSHSFVLAFGRVSGSCKTCSCIFLLLRTGKTPLHQCKFIYIYIYSRYMVSNILFFPYLLPFPSTQTLFYPASTRMHPFPRRTRQCVPTFLHPSPRAIYRLLVRQQQCNSSGATHKTKQSFLEVAAAGISRHY